MHYGKETPYDIKGALCGLVSTFLVTIVETLLNSSCPSLFKVDFMIMSQFAVDDFTVQEISASYVTGTSRLFLRVFVSLFPSPVRYWKL